MAMLISLKKNQRGRNLTNIYNSLSKELNYDNPNLLNNTFLKPNYLKLSSLCKFYSNKENISLNSKNRNTIFNEAEKIENLNNTFESINEYKIKSSLNLSKKQPKNSKKLIKIQNNSLNKTKLIMVQKSNKLTNSTNKTNINKNFNYKNPLLQKINRNLLCKTQRTQSEKHNNKKLGKSQEIKRSKNKSNNKKSNNQIIDKNLIKQNLQKFNSKDINLLNKNILHQTANSYIDDTSSLRLLKNENNITQRINKNFPLYFKNHKSRNIVKKINTINNKKTYYIYEAENTTNFDNEKIYNTTIDNLKYKNNSSRNKKKELKLKIKKETSNNNKPIIKNTNKCFKTLPDREKILKSIKLINYFDKINQNPTKNFKIPKTHNIINSNIIQKHNTNIIINNTLNNSKNFTELKKVFTSTFTLSSNKTDINSNIDIEEKTNNNILLSPGTSITKDNTFELKEIPITKTISKIDSCSIAGFSSPNIQKENQDKFFIKQNFLENSTFFIGVCDGHGNNGHLVSEYITKKLPENLKNININSIKNAFIKTNNSLINNPKIDCTLSGSTCTSLIITKEKIICANLGDSRAVLAKYENGKYNSINLSRDHKPTEIDEMKRILIKGGRISQIYDNEIGEFLGPQRVWIKNSNIPGLAMSRSFGDNLAHSVGVISEPEIKIFDFCGNEKFIVLASDGVWEYVDSDECVDIVKNYYENDKDAIGALNELVKVAFTRWEKEQEYTDDITAIVVFFD